MLVVVFLVHVCSTISIRLHVSSARAQRHNVATSGARQSLPVDEEGTTHTNKTLLVEVQVISFPNTHPFLSTLCDVKCANIYKYV